MSAQVPEYILCTWVQRVKLELEQSWRGTQAKTLSEANRRLTRASSSRTVLEPVLVALDLELAQLPPCTCCALAAVAWAKPGGV